MKRNHILTVLLFLALGLPARAQIEPPEILLGGGRPVEVSEEGDAADSALLRLVVERDSLNRALAQSLQSSVMYADSLQALHDQLARARQRLARLSQLKDSLVVTNDRFQKELEEKNALLEDKIKALQEKELLVAEKEQLYKDALSNSTVDKAKFEADLRAKEASIDAKSHEIEFLQKGIDEKESTLTDQREAYEKLALEKERYRHLVDSLRARVVAADQENIRKQEENKYLLQRAKESEERVAIATNRKKKVRPTQGIAMRFYRTPDWNIRLTPEQDAEGNISYQKQIWNRNAGDIEFDYVTGASVMLWDMSKFFNDSRSKVDSTGKSVLSEIPRFDQQFAYDLGLYVGFGGSNLFKNFYVGPSFRFMDFFYLTVGVNICEYEVLTDDYEDAEILAPGLTLSDITAKSWLVKPFVSLSIDLDFLSYIKK